ncbi:TetR/AcrR family transcriptional regulator [Streptomonospora arabica]
MNETGPGLRADARRNREKLVATARTVIAERGTAFSLDEVARRAGVGVGTVYRRFSDREALVQAVALEDFRRVAASARAAEAEEGTGWDALRRFVGEAGSDLLLAGRLSAWFVAAWDSLRADPENLRLRRSLMEVLDRMVSRAQQEGAVRRDVTGGDVALLLARVLRPLPGLSEGLDDPERHLAVVLNGLRPVPAADSPLPGRPPASGELG